MLSGPVQRFVETHGLTLPGAVRTTTTAGRVHLCYLLSELLVQTGAEIGVWEGQFSKMLCEHIRGLRLLCVDPWKCYSSYQDPKNDQARLELAYRLATATLTPYGCTILRTTSVEAAATVPDGSLDFIYLDANHGESFVRQDLEAWTPKVRSGGIVAGHDFVSSAKKPWLEVKPAVMAFTAVRGIGPVYVLAADKSPSFLWVQP